MVNHLTWEEKVGQMMMFGFSGDRIPQHISKFILRHNLGGTILFPQNITNHEQVKSLNSELQKLAFQSPSKINLMIAIEQEGGVVKNLCDALNISPGNRALGATHNIKWVEKILSIIAEELCALGFNMNLAPVVNVNTNLGNLKNAMRSFDSDPLVVESMAEAAIKGYGKHLLTVAKYFPGHEDFGVDYTLHTPMINQEWERLCEIELAPFERAIYSGVDALLVTHILFPALEKNLLLPASLSSHVLTGFLRQQLGFEGLIITDCVEDYLLANHYSMGEMAVMAINAGADILLIRHDQGRQNEAYKAVVEAVLSGRITMERIDQSHTRVNRAKKRLIQNGEKERPLGKKIYHLVNQEVIKHALDVVREGAGLPILLVEMLGESKAFDPDAMIESLVSTGFSVEKEQLSLTYTPQDKDRLISMAKYRPLTIFLSWQAYENENQIYLIEEMSKVSQDLIVIDISNHNLEE
ncbi:MAG TPA: hypothetical protein GXZ55_11575 [Natronincola sp.]|nr:hypothetical protein [Natronincola sp.]